MFEYISGILEEVSQERAVINVQGIGYELHISATTFNFLPSISDNVKLFVHFHVREDIQKLFGFFSKGEREVFRNLITVNMVGPKVAMSVLSGLSVEDIVYCVQKGDASRFKAISGVGPKTAQRIVMELKGKLNINNNDMVFSQGVIQRKDGVSIAREDAYTAMLSLGYNDFQVQNALTRVEQVIDSGATVEEWIKKALQVI